METIGKIRHRHLVNGESISAIARSLNLSRNTVKKYLKRHHRNTYRQQRQPKPQLGTFQETLEQWLKLDRTLPKAQRCTARRLFECLQAEGYRGQVSDQQPWNIQPGPRAD
jgi:transposase